MKKKILVLTGILLTTTLLSTQVYAQRPGQNGGGWSPTPYNSGGYRPYNGGGWSGGGYRPYNNWNNGGCWNCGIGAGLAIGAGMDIIAASLMPQPVVYQQPIIYQQPTYVIPNYPRVVYPTSPQVIVVNPN